MKQNLALHSSTTRWACLWPRPAIPLRCLAAVAVASAGHELSSASGNALRLRGDGSWGWKLRTMDVLAHLWAGAGVALLNGAEPSVPCESWTLADFNLFKRLAVPGQEPDAAIGGLSRYSRAASRRTAPSSWHRSRWSGA
jgi:hypothetical protein